MRNLILALVLFSCSSLSAQSTGDIGVELQIYPTGFIPGISYDHHIGASSSLSFRIGANIFDHRDLGVQDDEEGSGFGGSLGYKKYFSEGRTKWHWAVRTDIWSSDVDWMSVGPQGETLTGETSITVIQPTASIGYAFVNDRGVYIAPAFSFGFEWNLSLIHISEPTRRYA